MDIGAHGVIPLTAYGYGKGEQIGVRTGLQTWKESMASETSKFDLGQAGLLDC